VWVEPGAMKMPQDWSVPLILVGPGTGVAPFRSFLWERSSRHSSPYPAPCYLYFGCRSAAADFLYEQEWGALLERRALATEGGFVTAFSRDESNKVYVTHRIKENAYRVWELLQAGAHIYVSGSATKMPSDVAAAFESVVSSEGRMSQGDAAKYMQGLETAGRYRVEAWS
jgi:sulfite reductase alpha subunit-like flavoprotein